MSVAAELDRHRYVSLATFRASGAEVRTPVWFAAVGDKLYVFTGGQSGKVKRLRRSSRARVAACDARGNVTGPWHDATARLAGASAAAMSAMRAKYGWQKKLLDLFSAVSGRLRTRAWIEIEIARS